MWIATAVSAFSVWVSALLPEHTDAVQNSRIKYLYAKIAELKKSGLLVEYPDYGGKHRPKTMYEFAVSAYATHQNVSSLIREVNGKLNPTTVQAIARHFEAMELLIRETRPGLIALGVDIPRMNKEMEEVATLMEKRGYPVTRLPEDRFPDVPRGHWADQAVHELKRAGLLRGCPDGLFRG